MTDITNEYISDAIRNDNKCIIVINNNVYDITKYLRLHPGGEDILMNLNGQNATTEFNDIGHSRSAIKILEKFKIGSISDVENNKLKSYKDDKDDNETQGSQRTIIFVLFTIVCGIVWIIK
jgi:cytochrome b involved in lipid metabolism